MNDIEFKFCKDCKHCEGMGATFPICASPAAIDLVYGEPAKRNCSFQRSDKGDCGKDGKLFEQA